jgi:hypothetical protein
VASESNRVLTIGAAAGSLVLLAVIVFMLWPSDPTDYAFTSGRAEADGETVGWVSKVESNTIHVSSGPFGGGVIPLVVNRNTKITVGSKEGWFEDIRPGGQVKVAYEIYRGRRLARTVELLVDEGPRRPIRAEPWVKSTAGGADRVPAMSGPASAPTPDARPAPPSRAAGPAPAPAPAAPPAAALSAAKPAPPTPLEARPAPRSEPARVRAAEAPAPARGAATADNAARVRESVRPAEPPARASSPPPTGGRAVEPARGPESEATDGSAAVDWLLKGRR